MPDSIRYCLSNTDGIDHPDATGVMCLQQCGLCYESPFVVADGEVRVGESHERLLASVTESEER